MDQGSPKNLVKTHGNAKLRKGQGKPKESKWAQDAQGKTNGTQEPTSDVIKEPMAVLGHWEKNKMADPKRPSRIKANNFTAIMIE